MSVQTKRFRRLLSLLLCAAMAFALSTAVLQPAEAAGVKVKVTSLDFGKRVQGSSSFTVNGVQTYQLFKIQVPESGYLTLREFGGKTLLSNRVCLFKSTKQFQNNNSRRFPTDAYFDCSETSTQTNYLIPVTKGTYFIYKSGYDSTYNEKYDFSVKFKALSPLTRNFCRGTAAALKAGKTTLINAPDGFTYDRWFKITLSKSKKLSLTLKNMAGKETYATDLALYDARMGKYNLEKKGTGLFGSPKLSKGTYYVRVTLESRGAGVYQFGWK